MFGNDSFSSMEMLRLRGLKVNIGRIYNYAVLTFELFVLPSCPTRRIKQLNCITLNT